MVERTYRRVLAMVWNEWHLYVGDIAVTEVTTIGENTYRFVAPRRDALKPDDPISLAWTGQSSRDGKETAFRYQL